MAPLNLIRTNQAPARIGTTKIITVPTAPTTAVILDSGYMGMALFNVGPSTIVWGDSNITASTGGLLYYSMQKEWMALADTFTVYLRADSVAGTVVQNEYI